MFSEIGGWKGVGRMEGRERMVIGWTFVIYPFVCGVHIFLVFLSIYSGFFVWWLHPVLIACYCSCDYWGCVLLEIDLVHYS